MKMEQKKQTECPHCGQKWSKHIAVFYDDDDPSDLPIKWPLEYVILCPVSKASHKHSEAGTH